AHELRLAERAKFRRPLGAVHLAAFEEDRGADVMTAVQILQEIVEQIAVARAVPQVMVRVDDWPVGLERRLLRRGEPVLADRQMAGSGGGGGGGLHRRGARDLSRSQVCDVAGPDATVLLGL